MVPLYVSTLAYCLALTVFGPGGKLRMEELEKRRGEIVCNLGELRAKNVVLEREMKALLRDQEAIALSARELGYFQADERAILVNLRKTERRAADEGQFIPFKEPEWVFPFVLPIAAIVVFIVTRAVMLVVSSGSGSGVSARRTV